MTRSMLAVLPSITVTASFGVTEYVLGETVQSMLQRADSLLYEAKDGGRNQTFPVLG